MSIVLCVAVGAWGDACIPSIAPFILSHVHAPHTIHRLFPRFAIQRADYSKMRPLPTSSTCFNLLKLPLYPDSPTLEKSLLLAIRFGAEGFAFS